ncbi:hypothetical protein GGX14DRAFT_677391 [Mycena pura]|uniref:Uncharacterized protein n=1 Tax=Mycena pura TaxID=153505 RepID=A0AAD6UW94_9AGAR|nr:hypothetical protein GGX14DRAFT_677391 [Mycena pura]
MPPRVVRPALHRPWDVQARATGSVRLSASCGRRAAGNGGAGVFHDARACCVLWPLGAMRMAAVKANWRSVHGGSSVTRARGSKQGPHHVRGGASRVRCGGEAGRAADARCTGREGRLARRSSESRFTQPWPVGVGLAAIITCTRGSVSELSPASPAGTVEARRKWALAGSCRRRSSGEKENERDEAHLQPIPDSTCVPICIPRRTRYARRGFEPRGTSAAIGAHQADARAHVGGCRRQQHPRQRVNDDAVDDVGGMHEDPQRMRSAAVRHGGAAKHKGLIARHVRQGGSLGCSSALPEVERPGAGLARTSPSATTAVVVRETMAVLGTGLKTMALANQPACESLLTLSAPFVPSFEQLEAMGAHGRQGEDAVGSARRQVSDLRCSRSLRVEREEERGTGSNVDADYDQMTWQRQQRGGGKAATADRECGMVPWRCRWRWWWCSMNEVRVGIIETSVH